MNELPLEQQVSLLRQARESNDLSLWQDLYQRYPAAAFYLYHADAWLRGAMDQGVGIEEVRRWREDGRIYQCEPQGSTAITPPDLQRVAWLQELLIETNIRAAELQRQITQEWRRGNYEPR